MKLDYKNQVKKQDIDLNRLRPNKSYDHLMKNRYNRNYSFKKVTL